MLMASTSHKWPCCAKTKPSAYEGRGGPAIPRTPMDACKGLCLAGGLWLLVLAMLTCWYDLAGRPRSLTWGWLFCWRDEVLAIGIALLGGSLALSGAGLIRWPFAALALYSSLGFAFLSTSDRWQVMPQSTRGIHISGASSGAVGPHSGHGIPLQL